MSARLDINGKAILGWLASRWDPPTADAFSAAELLAGSGVTPEDYDVQRSFLSANGLIEARPTAGNAYVRLTAKGAEALREQTGGRPVRLPLRWRDLGHDYYANGGDVYYLRTYPARGADAATFEVLNHLWARDAKHVYCRSSRVRADRDSFRILNAIYARDRDKIFYIEGAAKGLDPDSFEVLDAGVYDNPDCGNPVVYHGYARDVGGVHFQDMMSGKPRLVRGADRETFRTLTFDYGTDTKQVYFAGVRLPKADPETFRVLTNFFSTDGRRVYYANRKIAGADAATFEVYPHPADRISRFFARDAASAYYQDRRLEGFDPAAFRPLDSYSGTDGSRTWNLTESLQGRA